MLDVRDMIRPQEAFCLEALSWMVPRGLAWILCQL